MSSRGSRSGRKRGGKKANAQKNGSQNNTPKSPASNGNKSSNRKRNRSKKAKQNPVVFWGNASSLPVRDHPIVPAANVHAIVESLGRAPIPGQEATSEHYFELVYDRAAGLALALAAAGGLDAPDVTPEPADPDKIGE